MTTGVPADDAANTDQQERNNREKVQVVVDTFNRIASKNDAIDEIPHDSNEEDLRVAIKGLPKEAQMKILDTYNTAMEEINRPDLVETPEQADKRHLKIYVYKLLITVGVVLAAVVTILLIWIAFRSGDSKEIGEVIKAFIESVAEILGVIFESKG